MEGLLGDLRPWSHSLAGQEAELELRGHFQQPVPLGRDVNVFQGLGRSQGEVLQHRGQDQEELRAGQALTQTEASS